VKITCFFSVCLALALAVGALFSFVLVPVILALTVPDIFACLCALARRFALVALREFHFDLLLMGS